MKTDSVNLNHTRIPSARFKFSVARLSNRVGRSWKNDSELFWKKSSTPALNLAITKSMKPLYSLTVAVAFFLCVTASATEFKCGVAKIDITPEEPIRLSGYAVRKTETGEIAQRLFVKALAISTPEAPPALLLTIDTCGISKEIRDDVAARLAKRKQIPSERLVICSSHTHSAPYLDGVIGNMFAAPLPPDQELRVKAYTALVIDKLERVALLALNNLQDAELAWGKGNATFAKNRRTEGGPVDHDVPVLAVRDKEGKILSVVANYACHCTTLGGHFNQVHGDWAGFAQEFIEKENPGAIALVTIGCGADSNPHPRGEMEHARTYGEAIARESARLLGSSLKPLREPLHCELKQIELPFDPLPTREQWEERAKQPGIVGYHATRNLARLDRGETLPTSLPYPITTWNFGDDLLLVFLPGEVVVDYALRLKNEFDPERIWVNGYSNYVPCYIPSERILKEGGYEAESSLWYYDRPARLSPQTEERIIQTVHEMVPKHFKAVTQN